MKGLGAFFSRPCCLRLVFRRAKFTCKDDFNSAAQIKKDEKKGKNIEKRTVGPKMGPAVVGRPPGVPEWRLNLTSSDPPSVRRMILVGFHQMTSATVAFAVLVLFWLQRVPPRRRKARSLAPIRLPAISTTSRLLSETSQTAPAARSEKYFCAIALDSSRARPVGVAHRLRLIGNFHSAPFSGRSSEAAVSAQLELEKFSWGCRGRAL